MSASENKIVRTVTGKVISDKMNKTIAVLIYRQVKHERYGKFIRQTSVFKAHDENNEAKTGDKVSIFETRRLSKTKRWKLSKMAKLANNCKPSVNAPNTASVFAIIVLCDAACLRPLTRGNPKAHQKA